jgi:hypothetical protein
MDMNKDHKAPSGKDEKVMAKKAMDASPDKNGHAKDAHEKDRGDKDIDAKSAKAKDGGGAKTGDAKGMDPKSANAKDGGAKTGEPMGKPGSNINAEYVVKQNNDLHHDVGKEMRDQLTGAAGKDPKQMNVKQGDQEKGKAH